MSYFLMGYCPIHKDETRNLTVKENQRFQKIAYKIQSGNIPPHWYRFHWRTINTFGLIAFVLLILLNTNDIIYLINAIQAPITTSPLKDDVIRQLSFNLLNTFVYGFITIGLLFFRQNIYDRLMIKYANNENLRKLLYKRNTRF